MKVVVVVLLLVLMCLPVVSKAADSFDCESFLESGNAILWAACRVGEWLAFNEAMDNEYYYGMQL